MKSETWVKSLARCVKHLYELQFNSDIENVECYEVQKSSDGILMPIKNIRLLACDLGVELYFDGSEYVTDTEYCGKFYFMYDGVMFYELVHRKKGC